MIIKAALLLFRDTDNGKKELLFARAYNRSYYILPGGKQEGDEIIEETLTRELEEEMQVGVENVKSIGVVEGSTPDGRALQMHLFSGTPIGTPTPSTEIEEVTWMTEEEALRNRDRMTPMTLEHVFPYLSKHSLW